MPIKLADIELTRIQTLRVMEHQAIVEHRIPGADGNIFQNMGREPVSMVLEGYLQREEGASTLETLRDKFNSHDPLDFSPGSSTAPSVKQVVIDSMDVSEVAGKPLFYRYSMVLREVMEQPAGLPGAGALDEVNTDIASEADAFMENLEAGMEDLDAGLDMLEGAQHVQAVVDQLSPKIEKLGELLSKLKK